MERSGTGGKAAPKKTDRYHLYYSVQCSFWGPTTAGGEPFVLVYIIIYVPYVLFNCILFVALLFPDGRGYISPVEAALRYVLGAGASSLQRSTAVCTYIPRRRRCCFRCCCCRRWVSRPRNRWSYNGHLLALGHNRQRLPTVKSDF